MIMRRMAPSRRIRTLLIISLAATALLSQEPSKASILKSLREAGISDELVIVALNNDISKGTVETIKGMAAANFSDTFYRTIIENDITLSASEVAELVEMKQSGINESLLLLTLPKGASESANVGDKPVVLVLDFDNQTRLRNVSLGPGIADMLTTHLIESGAFRIVERGEALAAIMNEQDLGMMGIVSSGSAAQVGVLLGASYVITGKVTEFGIRKTSAQLGFALGGAGSKTITARVVVDVRMVDVSTAEVIRGAYGIGEISTKVKAGYALPITMEIGTIGFDETTIGQATREALQIIVEKIAK